MHKGIRGYVGLDVHKDSIAVAVAEQGAGAARFVGRIAHDLAQLLKVLKRLAGKDELKIVYEAGPTGYGPDCVKTLFRVCYGHILHRGV